MRICPPDCRRRPYVSMNLPIPVESMRVILLRSNTRFRAPSAMSCGTRASSSRHPGPSSRLPLMATTRVAGAICLCSMDRSMRPRVLRSLPRRDRLLFELVFRYGFRRVESDGRFGAELAVQTELHHVLAQHLAFARSYLGRHGEHEILFRDLGGRIIHGDRDLVNRKSLQAFAIHPDPHDLF